VPASAKAVEPRIDERISAFADEAGNEYDTIPWILDLGECIAESLLSLLPRQRFELPLRPFRQGLADAVRVVKALEARMTSRTKLSPIHGMVGIAFHLDGAAFHGLY